MKIATEAAHAFIDLYYKLMFFAGQKRNILKKNMDLAAFKDIDMETKANCREALYEPKPLFAAFLKERGETINEKERKLIDSWAEHHVHDQFVVLRHLKKHTLMIDSDSPAKVYGVLSLFDDLEDIIPASYLPQIIQTTLLPYEGVIIYDGLLLGYNVMIGSNMRRDLKELYEVAKVDGRFITSLTEAPPQPDREEVFAYNIKEKSEQPIRRIRGLAAQVKKTKQLQWKLAETSDKSREKLQAQLQEAQLKIAALVMEFFEKDTDEK